MNAIFILAGTAIGSGMISLPIVLAHIGIKHTILLMLFYTIMTYFSALIRTELNLQSNSKFTLEDVGLKFSGKTAALIGNTALKLLPFSLLAAYIYGFSAILLPDDVVMKIVIAAVFFAILAFSSPKIMAFNQKLFVVLITVVIGSIGIMVFNVSFNEMPVQLHNIQFSKIAIILPTLFTSFGFQGSLHTITNSCDNDKDMIKAACFWGSVIPSIIYICWILCVIFCIYNSQPALFSKMAVDGIDINEFISVLCNASNAHLIKSGIFMISILAIGTSIIGVGISLVEDLEMTFSRMNIKGFSSKSKRIICAAIAIVPSTIVAICIPKAFINILSFAGMILAVIAIFLPSFLLLKVKEKLHFKVLNNRLLIIAILLFGGIIVGCEIFNLFFRAS